jgi:hypothetical protein
VARPVRQQQERNTVAIVGDGQTERIYFADVRDTDRPKNLFIFPDFPRKIGSYKGVLDRAMDLSKDHTRVYALIDLDKIIQDNQQVEYRTAKTAAQALGVHVLENNPCFEMWFLLHFMFTGRLFDNCNGVTNELRKNGRIPNYDKNEKFLSKARLYNSFKAQLQDHAIDNARKLEANMKNQSPLFPRAQTYQFFEWYFENAKY